MLQKQNKFHAVKVIIDGQKFDSKKEAARGMELKMLERVGYISDLKFQVPFVLQDGFRHNGKPILPIKYVADATYMEKGKQIVEDTKSPFTRKNPEFLIKKKMFLFRYPELIFREYV